MKRAALSTLATTIVALVLPVGMSFAASPTVVIDEGLTPATLTVTVDTTVTWRNDDGDRHRIRAYDYPGDADFDSGNLESGETYVYAFTVPGTYHYHDDRDREDEAYWGTVVVEAAAEPPSGGGSDGGSAPKTGAVSIADRAFSPRTITIGAGGTITWTNRDDDEHTVTARGGGFDSGVLGVGKTYARRFPGGGTFDYFCAIHPDMTGTVKVLGAPAPGGGTGPKPAPAADTVPPPPPGTAPRAVSIVDFGFTPATLRVRRGTQVVWTNTGEASHSVTGEARTFDSGLLAAGGRFAHTFDETGTFGYLCVFHPQMRGSVIVGAGGPVRGAPATPPENAAGPTAHDVVIEDFAFAPPDLTVAPGDTVSWVNRGVAPHTVTGDGFDSGMLETRARYRRTFAAEGVFAYACSFHPAMVGTIRVTAAGAAAGDVPAAPAPAEAEGSERPGAPLLGGSEIAAVLGGIPALLALALVVYLRLVRARTAAA